MNEVEPVIGSGEWLRQRIYEKGVKITHVVQQSGIPDKTFRVWLGLPTPLKLSESQKQIIADAVGFGVWPDSNNDKYIQVVVDAMGDISVGMLEKFKEIARGELDGRK